MHIRLHVHTVPSILQYVYIYIYIIVYIYTYIYIYIYIYAEHTIYQYIYIYIHDYMCKYLYVCTYIITIYCDWVPYIVTIRSNPCLIAACPGRAPTGGVLAGDLRSDASTRGENLDIAWL